MIFGRKDILSGSQIRQISLFFKDIVDYLKKRYKNANPQIELVVQEKEGVVFILIGKLLIAYNPITKDVNPSYTLNDPSLSNIQRIQVYNYISNSLDEKDKLYISNKIDTAIENLSFYINKPIKFISITYGFSKSIGYMSPSKEERGSYDIIIKTDIV